MIHGKKYFTLNALNYAIENMELGHLDSLDRPSVISYKTLFIDNNHSLQQQGKRYYVIVTTLCINYRYTDVGTWSIPANNGR